MEETLYRLLSTLLLECTIIIIIVVDVVHHCSALSQEAQSPLCF